MNNFYQRIELNYSKSGTVKRHENLFCEYKMSCVD
jgi:hypothetical protein